jgi:hypothetical protein
MTRLLLGIAAVLALWFIATDTSAQPQPHKGGKVHQLAGWPRTVDGIGKTEKEAQQDAVHNAVRRINECLKAQDPPLAAWEADEEYVRKHVLDGRGQAGEDVKLNVGPAHKVWIQPLREADVPDIVARNHVAERHVLSSERQTIAGYALAALSGLLALMWGYLRVDEWTEGRISKWLRIGAVAVAVIAALAWWMSV